MISTLYVIGCGGEEAETQPEIQVETERETQAGEVNDDDSVAPSQETATDQENNLAPAEQEAAENAAFNGPCVHYVGEFVDDDWTGIDGDEATGIEPRFLNALIEGVEGFSPCTPSAAENNRGHAASVSETPEDLEAAELMWSGTLSAETMPTRWSGATLVAAIQLAEPRNVRGNYRSGGISGFAVFSPSQGKVIFRETRASIRNNGRPMAHLPQRNDRDFYNGILMSLLEAETNQ